MELNINLKELERQFSLCIKCKQCTYGSWPRNLPICPIYDKYKFFTYSGGGLIYLARGILLGLIEKDHYDEALKVASKCTSCGYCGQTCKLVPVGSPHQNVTDLIRLLKINLVNKGVYLSEEHKQAIDRVKETKHLFTLSYEEEELKTLKNKVPKRGEVLIFSGCVTSHNCRENLKATIEVLNKARIDYQMMDDEWCCGSPLLDLGNVDGIAKLAEHNLEMIKAMGVNKVVFLCPHCQEIFQNTYPQVTERKLDFELIFITKYLKELIDKNKLKPTKSLPYKISYHDPCYLGRYLGDFESARDILNKIPNISLVEMERNKEESYCCGAGGGAKILDYDNSVAICQERIKEFKKTGGEVLVTSCPLCKSQFRDMNQSANKEIVIKDTVEILRESLD
jgi:heterodisulfide reductase subunit D